MEIRFLSFSTGQPHPLAEKPIIFIATKTLPLDISSLHFEIVGDFLVLLTTFGEWSENEDMFFLVSWKKGKAHSVSISGLTAHRTTIAYSICPASVSRMGNLHIFQFPLRRHPHGSQLDSQYARSRQDCYR
jgi:hypothetical protein